MVKMCFQFLLALLVALQVGSNLVEAYEYYQNFDGGRYMFDFYDMIQIPDSCTGQPFCFDKGEDYPDKLIDKLVENLRDMNLDGPEERIDFGSRSANGATNGPLECKANFTDRPIYYITDTNGQERVVVQSLSPKDFRQIYSLTWCSEEGPTNDSTHNLKGLTCVTQTMELEFFVLSENYNSDNTKITTARTRIPVCCRCQHDIEGIHRQFEQNRLNSMTKGISMP